MYGKTFLGILRTTLLIDKSGKIARIWRNVKVDGHADERQATRAIDSVACCQIVRPPRATAAFSRTTATSAASRVSTEAPSTLVVTANAIPTAWMFSAAR